MSGRYLLDTNIIIALFADDTAVKENLAKAEETFVPTILRWVNCLIGVILNYPLATDLANAPLPFV